MKAPFKRNGIIFIPATLVGWCILSAGFIYAVYIFIDIDSRSHSVSDTIINFVFNLVLISLLYLLIAFLFNKINGKQKPE